MQSVNKPVAITTKSEEASVEASDETTVENIVVKEPTLIELLNAQKNSGSVVIDRIYVEKHKPIIPPPIVKK